MLMRPLFPAIPLLGVLVRASPALTPCNPTTTTTLQIPCATVPRGCSSSTAITCAGIECPPDSTVTEYELCPCETQFTATVTGTCPGFGSTSEECPTTCPTVYVTATPKCVV